MTRALAGVAAPERHRAWVVRGEAEARRSAARPASVALPEAVEVSREAEASQGPQVSREAEASQGPQVSRAPVGWGRQIALPRRLCLG